MYITLVAPTEVPPHERDATKLGPDGRYACVRWYTRDTGVADWGRLHPIFLTSAQWQIVLSVDLERWAEAGSPQPVQDYIAACAAADECRSAAPGGLYRRGVPARVADCVRAGHNVGPTVHYGGIACRQHERGE